jgi:phage gpG-like protein
MALRMTFDFYGDVQLDRTLARFGDNIGDARPAWEKMADRFSRWEKRQFASEGRAGSGGWTPLSPRYAAWKARHFPGKGILVRTGELFRSLVERPFGVEHITEDQMTIGSDVAHGEFHQKGDGVPQRRAVELVESERREWVKILQQHVVSGT